MRCRVVHSWWMRRSSVPRGSGVSGGCGVSVKLDGFREIAERHPVGMEQVTENSESQALVIELAKYINELERRIEAE